MAIPDSTLPQTYTQPERQRGRGRIFHRVGSPYYWCAYYLRAKEFRESTHTTDLKKAQKFLDRRLKAVGADQIGKGPFVGPQQERLTINQLLDALEADYRIRGVNSPQFRSHLAHVRAHFGFQRAVDVTDEMIDEYIEQRRAAGAKNATINRSTQPLRQAYQLAIDRKRLTSMPKIRRLDESDNVRQGYFEANEFRCVVSHLPEYLQDFALYSYLTGWRKNSVANLSWSAVNDGGILLPAKYWKGREPQFMPIEGELADIFERRRAARAVRTESGIILTDLVFHRDGRRVGDFRKAWSTACRLTGVSGRLFHDLCRCCARNLDKAGVPRRVAMEVMGRKTESIYLRYRIVDSAEKRTALRQVQKYLRDVGLSAESPTTAAAAIQ